jgi:hypothetical protein
VCRALTSTPYGAAATDAIARALDAATAAGARAAPSCPGRGAPGGASAAVSCAGMVVVWEVMACGLLLYGKYRLERTARIKFAAECGWAPVKSVWPPAPWAVQAVVHAALYLQIAAALWAWLGCAPLLPAAVVPAFALEGPAAAEL